MEPYLQIFSIIVLIFSVVIHEVAHGYTALLYGDHTAKNMGRLTLNPIKHIDLFGSIIIPFLLVALNSGFILGWAKPVPYNPYNLKNRKWGEFWVAAAGPISNILIGVLFIILINMSSVFGFSSNFVSLSFMIVVINFVLAFFNLIPIPPLDGSKILATFLPFDMQDKFHSFTQRWGLLLVIIFVFFFWTPLFDFLMEFIFWATGIDGF